MVPLSKNKLKRYIVFAIPFGDFAQRFMSFQKLSVMGSRVICVFYVVVFCLTGCRREVAEQGREKIRVVFDTDANNELDDQHALAYLVFSGDVFAVEGVTVNATRGGGLVDEQYEEARRVLRLCNADERIKLFKGANGTFGEIVDQVDNPAFDGKEAVDFIIHQAHKADDRPLFVLAVGKLTNVALAIKKDPSICSRIRVVWLGSNYPDPGEYNQENDTSAVSYALSSDCPLEIVTVRYGFGDGTDAVRATPEEINQRMPGMGPRVEQAVEGRHGESFYTFGDYSVNLFEHINLNGDPPSRALYDMAAVAIVKNPSFAQATEIPCPVLIDDQWHEQPGNPRSITVWTNFDSQQIMNDFYETMENYIPADSI